MVKAFVSYLTNHGVEPDEAKNNTKGEYCKGFVMYHPTQQNIRDAEGRETKIKKPSLRLIERDRQTGVFAVAKDARDLYELKNFLWEVVVMEANVVTNASGGGR